MDDTPDFKAVAFAERLKPIADALATASGFPWHVEPHHEWHAGLVSDDPAQPLELAIRLSTFGTSKPDKIECSVLWPRDGHSAMRPREWGVGVVAEPPPEEPRATISLARDAATIARDMHRRVVVPGLPIYAACLAAKAERAAGRDAGHVFACKVADALKLPKPGREQGRDYTFSLHDRAGDAPVSYGTVRVGEHGTWVSVERLSVKPEAALKVLAALAS